MKVEVIQLTNLASLGILASNDCRQNFTGGGGGGGVSCNKMRQRCSCNFLSLKLKTSFICVCRFGVSSQNSKNSIV